MSVYVNGVQFSITLLIILNLCEPLDLICITLFLMSLILEIMIF